MSCCCVRGRRLFSNPVTYYVMFQVNKSSSDFSNSLKLTWQQCAERLPHKRWDDSVAEMDGRVFITTEDSRAAYFDPLMYDCNKD